jgi:hypothetical protein
MELNIPHVLDRRFFCAAPAKNPDCITPEVTDPLSDRKDWSPAETTHDQSQ